MAITLKEALAFNSRKIFNTTTASITVGGTAAHGFITPSQMVRIFTNCEVQCDENYTFWITWAENEQATQVKVKKLTGLAPSSVVSLNDLFLIAPENAYVVFRIMNNGVGGATYDFNVEFIQLTEKEFNAIRQKIFDEYGIGVGVETKPMPQVFIEGLIVE